MMSVEDDPRGCELLEQLGVGGCPCPDGESLCDAASAVELATPLPVAVVADAHPLLQGLRDELRPALAEVDGVLAIDALAGLSIDLDYPHDRLLIRCTDAARCAILPAVLDEERPVRTACLPSPAPGPGP
jgi:hypothetical protein